MAQRDRTVFRKIRSSIAWNLAGGYRGDKEDHLDPVLQTHRDTLKETGESHPERLAWPPPSPE